MRRIIHVLWLAAVLCLCDCQAAKTYKAQSQAEHAVALRVLDWTDHVLAEVCDRGGCLSPAACADLKESAAAIRANLAAIQGSVP